MTRLFSILLLVCSAGFAQIQDIPGTEAVGVSRQKIVDNFNYLNTGKAVATIGTVLPGTCTYSAAGPVVLFVNSTGPTLSVCSAPNVWTQVLGGGSMTWGQILGTLSSQADLTAALAGKAALNHASRHQNGGGDEIATATAGANAIPRAGAGGTLAAGWIPDLSATYTTVADKTGAGSKIASAASVPPDGCANWSSGNLGSTGSACGTGPNGITDLVQDLTPQLGGDLDMNGHNIQTVTPTEMTYLHGVTSAIQTQLGGKIASTDPRLTDARTPTAHATSHRNGGSDEVAVATAAANAIPKAGTGAKLDIGWIPTGSTASTVAVGNDARLSDARTPVAPTASTLGGTKSFDCTGTGHLLKIDTTGTPTCSADSAAGGGIVNQTTGAGAPSGSCTAPSAANLTVYSDTTNQDEWFCSATNTWKKLLSTANTGTYVEVGTSGTAPSTPPAGQVKCYFDSTAKTQICLDENGNAFIGVKGQSSRDANKFVTHVTALGIPQTAAIAGADLPNPGASSKGGVQSADCSGTGHVQKINTDGTVTCSADSGTLPTASGNKVVASPADGTTGTAAARSLVTADLPGAYSCAEGNSSTTDYACTPTNPPTAWVDGETYQMYANAANTAATGKPTFAQNSLTAAQIMKQTTAGEAALAANDIQIGWFKVIYNQSTGHFLLQTPPASSGVSANQNLRRIPFGFDGGGSALSGTMTRCNTVAFGGTLVSISATANAASNATFTAKRVATGSYTGEAGFSGYTAFTSVALSSAAYATSTAEAGATLTAGSEVCVQMTLTTSAPTWASGEIVIAAN